MRINGIEGEYGFNALIKWYDGSWRLSVEIFFSPDEVQSYLKYHEPSKERSFKWPVEVMENGAIYVPSAEELK